VSRYYSRRPARSFYVEDDTYPSEQPMIPQISVDDHEAVDTGLLDLNGDTIMRAPNPMGFGRDDEW